MPSRPAEEDVSVGGWPAGRDPPCRSRVSSFGEFRPELVDEPRAGRRGAGFEAQTALLSKGKSIPLSQSRDGRSRQATAPTCAESSSACWSGSCTQTSWLPQTIGDLERPFQPGRRAGPWEVIRLRAFRPGGCGEAKCLSAVGWTGNQRARLDSATRRTFAFSASAPAPTVNWIDSR